MAARSESQPADKPPARPRRWRRRLLVLAAILGVLYAALWVVRWVRDFEPVRALPYFDGPALIMAHRGGGAAREHSFAAYRASLAAGATVLELDLRATRDGVPVVAHDATLERIYGAEGRIRELTLAELRERVPDEPPHPLEDVLAAFPDVRVNIEMKDDVPGMAEAVAARIAAAGATERALVASFHGDVLERFRELAPDVATSASGGEGIRFFLCYLLEVPCRPDYEALQVPPAIGDGFLSIEPGRREFIDFAHRHGLEVHFWTVDDAGQMRRLLAAGADGLITNHPERARRVLDELTP